MAAPTPNFNTVAVRGKFVGTDGEPIKGRIIFTPKASRLVDLAALTTIIGRAVSATLDKDGAFELFLPATDDPDITPEAFTYEVKEDFSGGTKYQISVPLIDAEFGIELASVAPVAPNTGAGEGAVTRLEFDDFRNNFQPELLDAAILEAQNAQAAAEAAQAAAEAVGDTNDAIMTTVANDSASTFSSALSASIGAPAHASETGVISEKYPYGDLRRYGITPDGVTDWTTTGEMQKALDSAKALSVPVFVPAGYYATSLLLYSSDLRVILQDGAEFGGIIHIGGVADAVIQNINVEGTAVTYDRFGIYDCDGVTIGAVHCKADGAKNVTYPGVAGRGFHASASAFNVRIGDITVDDMTVGLPAHSNHAAFAVDGYTDNPRGFKVGRVWVRDSQVHGVYLTGVGHSIGEIRVDAYGAGSFGDDAAMEDADSIAQSQELKGVWLNRCLASTVDKITVGQAAGSRPNAIYDVLIEDTGKSGSGAPSGQVYGTNGKVTIGSIALTNLTGASRGIGIGDHGYIPAGNAQANVQVGAIAITVTTAKAVIAGYAAITVAENASLICPDIRFTNLDTYEGVYVYATGVAALDVIDVGNCKNRVLYAAGRTICRDLRFRTISSGSAPKVEFAAGAEFSDVGLYADTGVAVSQSLLKNACSDVIVRKMYGGPSAAAAGAVASTGARFKLERFKLVGNNSSAGSFGVKIEGADVYLGPGEATLFGTNFAKTAGALSGTAVQVQSSGAITANTSIPAATLATLGCAGVQL